MKKILVILGPTATGKTDLALGLAKKFNGELISCDSRQVYKGLDIGTGKEPGEKTAKISKGNGYWEIEGIRVWMYDIADPKIQYSVFNYVQDASKVIREISDREKLPIIVGGTGLYLKGLLQGFKNLKIPVDAKLREVLEKLSLEELQKKLNFLSPIIWTNLNESERNNSRRLIRKIEYINMYPYINTEIQISGLSTDFDILKIGLTAPRPYLNDRIDLRLNSRINQGLIIEGKRLLKEGVSLERMKQLGLEYGCLAQLLDGQIDEEEFVRKLKTKIHQYAKRQLTWFKTEKNVEWFDISEPEISHRVESQVYSWYN